MELSKEEQEAIDLFKEVLDERSCLISDDIGENDIKVVLNLIKKQSKVIDELKNKLEKHIKFCEQESSGHINNNVCHISLKFDKSLLEIINRKVEEDD